MDLINLQQRFTIPGAVEISEGLGGLPKISMTAPGGSAEVYLHGAHVTAFTPAGDKPVLFVSRESHFAQGRPIRGGVPVIFPWFGPNALDAALPPHGFARALRWDLVDVCRREEDRVSAELRLSPDVITREVWPREFALSFTVTVGRTLEMSMAVRNVGDKPFRFEQALHIYLAVSDVKRVAIDGLASREFLDKMDHGARKTQPTGPFNIVGETDRVYFNTPDTVTVHDPDGSAAGRPRVIAVSKQGSASTVVWNPWIAKAASLSDFGDDEWPDMLCIETGNIGENALTLDPGQQHVMTATIGTI